MWGRFFTHKDQWQQAKLWRMGWRVIQCILGPLLFYVLYQQIWPRLDWDLWRKTLSSAWQSGAWTYLLWVILLMPINWILETQKWRLLLRPSINLRFGVALQAVLRGITVSLFTPNRMGEYGGRILSALPGQHWGFVRATLLGSLAQWAVLLFCAWPALLWVGQDYMSWSTPGMGIALGLGWLGCGLILLLYFSPQRVGNFLPGFRRLQDYVMRRAVVKKWLDMEGSRTPDPFLRLSALALAGVRYLVYSVQFLLLLYFFGYDINPLLGLAGISAIFLLQAGIPLPPGIGLLVRTELALLIWPEADPATAVAATMALFIINLAFPALLGLVFIVKMKDVKSLSYAQPQTT